MTADDRHEHTLPLCGDEDAAIAGRSADLRHIVFTEQGEAIIRALQARTHSPRKH